MKASTHPGLSSRLAPLGWAVFTGLACVHFSLVYFWRALQFLNLALFAGGGERVPYQTRILTAWLLHLTAGSPHLGPVLARLASHAPKEFHDPYVLVMLGVTCVSLFIAVLAARATLLHLTNAPRFASWAALLTIYMAYFNLTAIYGLTYILPYDVPALALFSIAVYLVVTRRYWVLLPLFAIGTLNRETFCFVTIFLALYAWFSAQGSPTRERRVALRRVAPHILLQAAVWLALRMWLSHKFRFNLRDIGHSSGVVDFELLQNFKSLLNPPQWPLFLGLFGFTLPLFIGGYRWISDRALARSVAILLPIWLLAMLVVGVIVEVRIFDELTAFLVPCIALILWNRWILPASRSLAMQGSTPEEPLLESSL